ncbi:MAG TPA: shikimate dehydrogenase [Eggerthellaceae bacterium]|nr:shikimate dehydrogenase [Eggerthellaceae bacterium]
MNSKNDNPVKGTGITGHTHMVAMIGSPVEHSASPATHSLAYKKLGIDAVFLVFDVTEPDLSNVMGAFRAMKGWVSTTVTMPLKQAVIPYLDELSDEARLIGSVNMITKESDGRLVGHNTDGKGFMNNLEKNGVTVKGATMTLVGPGGAGSAIFVQAALDGVARLDVFAREGGKSYRHALLLKDNIEKALKDKVDESKDTTNCQITIYSLENKDQLKQSISESDILANGTNIGMGEGNNETPVAQDLLRPGMVVADVIYAPIETQLLKDAKALGCKTFNGLGMLDEQAVVADKIRFGVEIPIKEIRAELS